MHRRRLRGTEHPVPSDVLEDSRDVSLMGRTVSEPPRCIGGIGYLDKGLQPQSAPGTVPDELDLDSASGRLPGDGLGDRVCADRPGRRVAVRTPVQAPK
jgi:hypothetical protein